MVKLQSALQSLKRIGGNWMTWKCSVFADKTRRYGERSRVSETDVFNELCLLIKAMNDEAARRGRSPTQLFDVLKPE